MIEHAGPNAPIAPFRPTHIGPNEGMDSWTEPDPSRAADNRLDPDLPVLVLEETTGWAHVRCSNGWETWVDASKLVAIAPAAFAPTHIVASADLDTREIPDAAQPPSNRLEPGLPVEITERRGDWARVRCSNGWETWVDARGLAPGRSGAPRTAMSSLATWLPILGAATAVLGGFLPWFKGDGASASAWDIELVSLFTREDSDFDLKTGPVLFLVLLVVLPLLTRRPLPRWGAVAIAAVATNIGLLGVRLYLDFPEPRPDLGIGLILTLLGGVVMTAGVLVTPRAARPMTVSA